MTLAILAVVVLAIRFTMAGSRSPDRVPITRPSKGVIPINELAKEFGGNGHLNAAGARLYKVSLHDVTRDVLEAAEKYVAAPENT